jgi:pimeloyl-ACP methyl ester carboxylesterase
MTAAEGQQGEADENRPAAVIESPGCPPGSRYSLLPGVRSRMVQTPSLVQHVYESGPPDGEPLLLIHGNASSARWFEDLMAALPEYHILAPDLRGYGATELKRVDAARGLRDYADDVHALVESLGLERLHLLGWSLGGCVAMRYTLDHPERVRTLTLHSSGSPYGYGGTRDAAGTPTYEDFAGSGGGLISPQVVERYLAKDFTADSPFSPRSGLRTVILKLGFQLAPEREDALVEQMLMMAIGDEYYPGDKGPLSPNWPFITPGLYGSNNALSPKYCDLSGLAELRGGPPMLWIRGSDDLVVSDAAAVDPAYLGKLGAIPGWPGEEVCPPQPMLAQLRAVLERYAANGGTYQEMVIADCGHAPLLEKQDDFLAHLRPFLSASPLAFAAGARPAAPAALDDSELPTEPETPIAAAASAGHPPDVPTKAEPAADLTPSTSSASSTATTPRKGRRWFGFLRRR